MGEIDPLTDVSHGAYGCSAQTYIHTQMKAAFMCKIVIYVVMMQGLREKKAALRIHFKAFQVSSSSC